MSLSRKQKKELKKLRSAASDIWDDQKDVFERAGKTLAKAGHHAADYGRSDDDNWAAQVDPLPERVNDCETAGLLI